MVVDQFAQQRNHDDGGGQVIQHGREEESNQTHHPEQRDAFVGADAVSDDLETFMGIDQFDDGHGAHEEEQDLGDLTQVMAQLFSHVMVIARGARGGGSDQRQNAVRAEYQQGPANDGSQDGRRGFIDFQGVFEGDAQVTEDKDQCHQRIHGQNSICRAFLLI